MTYNEFLDKLKKITKRNDLYIDETEYSVVVTAEKDCENFPCYHIVFSKELQFDSDIADEFISEFDTVTQMGIKLLLDEIRNTKVEDREECWVKN